MAIQTSVQFVTLTLANGSPIYCNFGNLVSLITLTNSPDGMNTTVVLTNGSVNVKETANQIISATSLQSTSGVYVEGIATLTANATTIAGAGYSFLQVNLLEVNGFPVVYNAGTTPGGTDIVNGASIAANGFYSNIINNLYFPTNTTIYHSSSNWNGAKLKLTGTLIFVNF